MSVDIEVLLEGRAGRSGLSAAAKTVDLEALELLTVDADGWPHVAWLGPGEVVPVGPDRLAMGVWPGSATRANLDRGHAVLQVVVGGVVNRLRLATAPMGEVSVGAIRLATYLATVSDVLTDEVKYAEVESGLIYRLHDRSEVLERWAAQVEAITAAVETHTASDSRGD